MSEPLIIRLEIPHIVGRFLHIVYPDGYGVKSIESVKEHILTFLKIAIKDQRGIEILIPPAEHAVDYRSIHAANRNTTLHQDVYADVLMPTINCIGECEITASICDNLRIIELNFQ